MYHMREPLLLLHKVIAELAQDQLVFNPPLRLPVGTPLRRHPRVGVLGERKRVWVFTGTNGYAANAGEFVL